jgi:tetratricopeptide (TPR) repeat protein
MDFTTTAIDDLFAGGPAATEKPASLRTRGIDCLSRGDAAGALDAFGEGTRQSPERAEVWNNHGFVLLTLGRPAKAINDFDRALTLKPDHAEALNNRGRARQLCGDVAGALADFERALALASGTLLATVHHNRGALRQATGDLAGALADYDRALELDPTHVATHVNRGTARQEAGDLSGALADIDLALTATARSAAAPVYHVRGCIRAARNDFTGAIADYDEAIRIAPRFALAYLSRGNARYHRRDARGLVDYRTALGLDPEGMARALVRTLAEGRRRGADDVLANCDQHLRINERDVLAHARRGLTLVLLGRQDESAGNLARFRELAPEFAGDLDRLLAAARRSAERLEPETPACAAG